MSSNIAYGKYNLLNKRFKHLLVIRQVSGNRGGCRRWECLCDCGTTVIYSSDHLTRKKQPVKSCGCLRSLEGKAHKDFKGFGEINKSWWQLHIERPCFNTRRRISIPIEIDIIYGWELFELQNRKCAYSGVTLQFSMKTFKNTASLDRIDSNKGYIKGNVQWVHKHINLMKNVFTDEYFKDLCCKIAKNHNRHEI